MNTTSCLSDVPIDPAIRRVFIFETSSAMR
jgi:hypothetical protein